MYSLLACIRDQYSQHEDYVVTNYDKMKNEFCDYCRSYKFFSAKHEKLVKEVASVSAKRKAAYPCDDDYDEFKKNIMPPYMEMMRTFNSSFKAMLTFWKKKFKKQLEIVYIHHCLSQTNDETREIAMSEHSKEATQACHCCSRMFLPDMLSLPGVMDALSGCAGSVFINEENTCVYFHYGSLYDDESYIFTSKDTPPKNSLICDACASEMMLKGGLVPLSASAMGHIW